MLPIKQRSRRETNVLDIQSLECMYNFQRWLEKLISNRRFIFSQFFAYILRFIFHHIQTKLISEAHSTNREHDID